MKNPKLIDKDDKIFIAGHKGMVGSAIYRKLVNDGYIFKSKTLQHRSEYFKEKLHRIPPL